MMTPLLAAAYLLAEIAQEQTNHLDSGRYEAKKPIFMLTC